MSRRFTLREAESLLPEVERNLREAISSKQEYERAEAGFQSVIRHIMAQGGVIIDREQAQERRLARDRAAIQLKSNIESIQESGCLIKDLDIGLVDFPTLFRGQEVYLCWKLGEKDIQFWHGTNEGFAGRKPIDRDFLDHHEGDQPN
jgi:hypothetical protein